MPNVPRPVWGLSLQKKLHISNIMKKNYVNNIVTFDFSWLVMYKYNSNLKSIKKSHVSFTARNINAPEDSIENSTRGYNPCPAINTDNQLGSPAAQVMPNPAVMHRPPRPRMPPLQPPPGMPNPHMRPFPSPLNMQHMPPQMIRRGGPMFPPDRVRMSMPFPPRGPPFQRFPHPRPEIMDDEKRENFRTERPGFRFPHFQRGGW